MKKVFKSQSEGAIRSVEARQPPNDKVDTMSTNYYLPSDHPLTKDMSEEDRHIGKQSMGWKFIFQANPYIQNALGWRALLKVIGSVENEYGVHLDEEDFWLYVESKQDHKSHLNSMGSSSFVDSEGYEFCNVEFF